MHNLFRKRAGFACLFLWLYPALVTAQEWTFDDTTAKAYALVLNLQTANAIQLVAEPKNAQEHYVAALAETLELLITEDQSKFADYEAHFESRIESKIKGMTADYQFLMAEMHLQRAFVYLKFGHEFNAATHLRDAYQIAKTCRSKFPEYIAIKKTTGLLDIILGSVPEKYNWILGILGMQGSIETGLNDLEIVRASDHALAFEADLLHCLVQGFIFQKPETGFALMRDILQRKPGNRLARFIAASLAIKNGQSEEALTLLTELTKNPQGLPLHYAHYLKGEVYLHKAEYQNAITAYRWFINHYRGQNYLKDAHYKIGLCYWLNGNVNDAMLLFNEARNCGRETTEADKSAARSLSDKNLPNIPLSKARYATDGGYYQKARELLSTLTDRDLPEKRDQVEYYYRKARLEHKTGKTEAAKFFYRQTIDMSGNANWYFAPNACLQLGYILAEEKKTSEAKQFFRKALSYKKHEYKNSIDSKARSALATLQHQDR